MKKVYLRKNEGLSLAQFREMDYYAVENYDLPIELMMENAGLQLANLVAMHVGDYEERILIGVGNGNNGGGGLVAARRLSAWGYDVYLDLFSEVTKELPKLQLERALKFGAKVEDVANPDVWVDAYLGFSQRLPLPAELEARVNKANATHTTKISLDIPTGYANEGATLYFDADLILTLAAPKSILFELQKPTVFITDLGIPHEVYQEFDRDIPAFHNGNILEIAKEVYVHEHLKAVHAVHVKTLTNRKESTIREFIGAYALNLAESHEIKGLAAKVDLSNYYKPLIGRSVDEIFQADLNDEDYRDAAAAVHGFERFQQVPSDKMDLEFEEALDLLLQGNYYELKSKIKKNPRLILAESQFGHKAGLIHYCASNAVEIYRQVVPMNLKVMVQLLIEFGADPRRKIPVYGGYFDFFELFESSAHPKKAGITLSSLEIS